jgi:sulfonate transport system ATP-binding protein
MDRGEARVPSAGELVIDGVSKTFFPSGRTLPVLRGIDLTVLAGEFLSVVGTSGCGKSTLLRTIAGLEYADTGRLTLDGEALFGPGLDRGLVFQEHRLLPWLTVLDNIAFGLGPSADRGARQQAFGYVEIVGLGGFQNAYPHQLSGGMAQRAAIARALIGRPRVLLLDEPFAALDAFTRIQLQEEVLRIWRRERTTIILVTHDIDEAIFLGDRIAIMSNRPGTLRRLIDVDLPRPRDRTNDDFGRIRSHVFHQLFEVHQPSLQPNLGGGRPQ